MNRRFAIVAAASAAVALGGAAFASGAGHGLIWDDGHYAKPGALDDGKDLLPQAGITVKQAVAAAQQAKQGELGQVDLEHLNGTLVFTVDVGSQEVHVNAADGSIASVTPRD